MVRPVAVQLRLPEAVGEALPDRHNLGPEHVAVEDVRALPVRDMDDAMIEGDGQRHRHSIGKPT
jgi:hypothetical protein